MRWFIAISFLFFAGGVFGQSQNEKLAYQYFSEKQYEKAVTFYEELYDGDADKKYYEPLLTSFLFLERYRDAEKLVKKHIKKHPSHLEYGVDLGFVYEQDAKNGKAEKAYEHTIDAMIANVNSILSVGNRFYQKGKYDYAITAYKKGAKLLDGDYPFSFELAKVYEAKGDHENMSKSLISVMDYGKEYLESVKGALSTIFNDDANHQKRDIFKDELLLQVQKKPGDKALTELLIWFFMQEKQFGSALRQAKALDKRNKESGIRIINLAKTFVQNKAYDDALDAYEYLLNKKDNSYFYRKARIKSVEILNLKIDDDPNATQEDISRLEQMYVEALDELGRNNYSIDLIRGYALLLAYHTGQLEKAKSELENAINIPRAKPSEIAKCKLALGDIYVMEDEVWEAALLYGQVNEDFKEDMIGHTAKLKTAKAYFYTGEFEWAKAQLDVLKASTTKLIANDALQLSVIISDNLGMDTTTAPLKLYAKADLLQFQNKDSLSILACDELLEKYPSNLTLLDDVYFKKAQIYFKQKQWDLAIAYYQKAVDYNDLLKDDALFKIAEIYERILNEGTKAQQFYEQIIIDHPDSFYISEARKRYRKLRGDTF